MSRSRDTMAAATLRFDRQCDLHGDPSARRATRRPTIAHVRFAMTPGVIETAEGAVRHRAFAAIVTGARGEEWPVERAHFESAYEPLAPTRMGEAGSYRRRPSAVLARRLDQPFVVELGDDRGALAGAAGDWLIQHGSGDLGVVNALAFAETYDILTP